MSRRSYRTAIPLFGLTAALLAGCGGSPTPAASQPTAPSATQAAATSAPEQTKLVSATYTSKLGESKEPTDTVTSYAPADPIYLSVRFAGRPKSGVVRTVFFWRKQQLAEAKVDFADANSGVIFSVGQDTYAGFTLSHTEPFPLSENYRAEVFLDDAPIGTFPFKIAAPSGSVATAVRDVVLAEGADASFKPIGAGTTFAPDTAVTLLAQGDFSKASWAEFTFYAKGQTEPLGVKNLSPLAEDVKNFVITSKFKPEGGWKPGSYEVGLTVNDKEIGRYPFTIAADGAQAAQPTAAAQPAAGGALTLVPFTWKTGLFQISVPQGWSESLDNSPDSVTARWTDPAAVRSVGVIISPALTKLSPAELQTQAVETVKAVYGNDAKFTLGETATAPDGSIVIPWTSVQDGTVTQFVQYVEIRGDKYSTLTVIFPESEYDTLWKGGLEQVVNSYKIDPSVKFE